jgi:hypothetical protein
MIHLTPEANREASVPASPARSERGRIESGFAAAAAQRGQIRTASRGIHAAASSNRTNEQSKGDKSKRASERANGQKWNLSRAKAGRVPGPEKRSKQRGKTLLTPSGIPGGEGTGGGIRKRRVGEAEGGDGESREDDDSKK